MTQIIRLAVILLGVTALVFGQDPSAPEINGSSAAGAVALLSGAVLVLRASPRR